MDGKPLYQEIPESGIMAVINANADLLYHLKKDTHYLFTGEAWLYSKEISGPWKSTSKPALPLRKIPDNHLRAYLKDMEKVSSPKDPEAVVQDTWKQVRVDALEGWKQQVGEKLEDSKRRKGQKE